MRREFEIAFAYALAAAFFMLGANQTASQAAFSLLSVAAPLWIVISNIGSMIPWLFASAGIFFYGQFTKLGRKIKARTAGAILFFGIWLNAGIAMALKDIFQVVRPAYEMKVFELSLFGIGDGFSMPSGHTQMTFMCAAIIGYFYPKTRIPLLTFACLVAISRVGLGAHWILDVLFGAANGLLIAFLWMKMPWETIRKKITK